jgi:transcriptional regulator with XRE-family HTH domain
MSKIVIDEEFKNLIPPLSDEEYQQLTDNLIKEGCRDALITWNGILIDGHNRYEICKYHKIEFKTIEKEFKDRGEVVEWIIRNQFGRRNLSAYDRSRLALQLENVIKAKAKERQKEFHGNQHTGAIPQKSAEVQKPIETREELAKIAGVSRDTISKVKIIEREATPEQKAKLSKGVTKINTVYKEIKQKEDKPVETPDKQEEETRKEQKESLPSEPVDNLEDYSIPNITQYIETVKRFSCDINPLCFMQFRYKTLTKEQRRDLLEYISHAKKSLEIIETQIKTNI